MHIINFITSNIAIASDELYDASGYYFVDIKNNIKISKKYQTIIEISNNFFYVETNNNKCGVYLITSSKAIHILSDKYNNLKFNDYEYGIVVKAEINNVTDIYILTINGEKNFLLTFNQSASDLITATIKYKEQNFLKIWFFKNNYITLSIKNNKLNPNKLTIKSIFKR